MKKFILSLLVVLGLAIAAAVVIHFKYPETAAGEYVQIGWDWTLAKYEVAADWTCEHWNAAFGGGETEPPAAEGQSGAEPDAKVAETPAAEPDASAGKTAEPEKTEQPAPPPVKKEGWQGLDAANWIAGRKIAERDLKGKVVLLYVFDASSERSLPLLPRVQQIYSSFKHKPFLVVGSAASRELAEVKKALKERKNVTFPVYADAEPAFGKVTASQRTRPYFLVIDSKGKIVHRGISEQEATEAIVNAIGEIGR